MSKTIFLFLSLGMWIGGSTISNFLFPTNSVEDINNYWELKKIIYAVCIVLIILSNEYKTKFHKLLALVFVGVLFEDISDRLNGINYFQYSDILIVDLIIISSIYIIYKNGINFKVFNNRVFNNGRN